MEQTISMWDERCARARRVYARCCLCERRCRVDRLNGQQGFCRATAQVRVHRHRVEYGEELELIPAQLIYVSGCNMRCAFCIGQQDAFDPQRGQLLTASLLKKVIAEGRKQGVRNLQWVGGEPTVHLPAILEAMAGCRPPLPVVWKSNFFGTVEAFALLEGVVDVYVADFKFGNDACAERIAGVRDYLRVVTRNLLLAAETSRLIVRHLVLPGHFDCCFRPVVDWMGRHLPRVRFRVMTGYLPRWRAGCHEELASPLGRETGVAAVALAQHKGLNVIG